MNNNCKCDKCKKLFIPTLKTKKSDKGDRVHKIWFKCPYCKNKYTAYYTDKNIRKLQFEQRKIQQQIANINYDNKLTSEEKEIKNNAYIELFENNKKLMSNMLNELKIKEDDVALTTSLMTKED